MRKNIIFSLFFCGIGFLSFGQAADSISTQDLSVPNIWLKVIGEDNNVELVDVKNNILQAVTTPSLTNYNPSVLFGDSSVYSLVYPSLRTDSVVTIFTAYQTEGDGVVGLWEIDSDTNRQLWLNSQRASLSNTSIRYRKTTEKGVIVNTIRTEYPPKVFDTIFAEDSTYLLSEVENTNDTLFVGKSKEDYFDNGSFCEWIYFLGTIETGEQQKWESYLAIKYGARLSNVYVNSLGDTLWNSKEDSLYSIGIGGIGRDDSLTLNQPKSTIYNDNLTIEAKTQLNNRTHILWGYNELLEEINPDEEGLYFMDTVELHPLARVWKLNAHTATAVPSTKLTYNVPAMLIPNVLRLVVNTQDSIIYDNSSVVYLPTNVTDERVTFDSLQWAGNTDYYLRIVAVGDSIYKPLSTKSSVVHNNNSNVDNSDFFASVTPNPSNTGAFTFEVRQSERSTMVINITDAQGKTVYSEEQSEPTNHYTLNYKIDKQGIYFINVKTPNNKKSVKLIVSK
jgi:hypothetical protein